MQNAKKREHENEKRTVEKLMVKGQICLEGCSIPVDAQRGMPIYAKDGVEVGKVAAVVQDARTKCIKSLLLSRLPQVKGYWLVPVKDIKAIQNGEIQLAITNSTIESLERWHPI